MRQWACVLQHMTYRHVCHEANYVPDDMANRALAVGADVVFWNGQVPADCPPNQV